MSELKSYKIFVINLDRSVSRWGGMRAQLEKLGLPYERFSAIDGREMSDELLRRHYSAELNRRKYYVDLSRSEIACYISHLKVCEKILSENLDYAIVLEDDIVLKDTFALVPQALTSVASWNYVKLIAPFRGKEVLSGVRVNGTPFELVRWKKPPSGTQAYAITKDGAREFLARRSRFFRPIDVDLQHTWETKLDIQGLMPPCCELADTPSGISRGKHYHYPLARLVYKFRRAARSFVFRFRLW